MISITAQTNLSHYELKSVSLVCPHCGNSTSPIVVSIPIHSQMIKYGLKTAGIAFACTTCRKPIYLEYNYNLSGNNLNIQYPPKYILKAKIDFDYEFVPGSVAEDFKEALECYRHESFNAFAAMCRRTIQETATNLGA